jgi:hypothetical protein
VAFLKSFVNRDAFQGGRWAQPGISRPFVLPPEGAMTAVAPLLHEIIPDGWTRLGLVAPDATITCGYAENPGAAAAFHERFWRFMDDPSAPASLWVPAFRAVGTGWTLHRQGGGYREIEAPLDSCWLLGAIKGG